MTVAEKPGVLERLGSALNSSDLSPVEGRIGAVELIGALAYTQTNPDGAEHGEMDAAHIDPRTELASVLVRLKYGGDRVLGDRAALLLLHWVRHQKAFGKWRLQKDGDTVLNRFVRQGLAEWLFPVCQVCSGRELLGLDRGQVIEKRIGCTRCKGSGSVQLRNVVRDCLGCGGKGWKIHRKVRQTKPRECPACNGTGRLRASESERAQAIGVEYRVYERHWARRFAWLASGLDRLDTLELRCLQNQMRQGKTSP